MLQDNRPILIYSKLRLGNEAYGNKTKEIILKLRNELYISFVLFSEVLESSMYEDEIDAKKAN